MQAISIPTPQLSAEALAAQVKQAYETQQPLNIVGAGSKAAFGHPVAGQPLDMTSYQGIINYEPSELVITARAGTPLHIIEATLAEQGQMLGFEPPRFNNRATLGGTIACGLSGPRRPYSGAARDFVLGCRIINGQGELLNFGGQVMKNVAGYDVSRLMCGAQGTLGVLLDISLKVIPQPQQEHTLRLGCDQSQASSLLSHLGRQPLPISATLFSDNQLYIRLSGSQSAVTAAADQIGGEPVSASPVVWQKLRDQQHAFFKQHQQYWRLSLPPACQPLPEEMADSQLIEWGGAQRWVTSQSDPDEIWQWARDQGGHATFHTPTATQRQPLEPGLLLLSQQLRQSFDPHRILNPDRLYTEL